MDTVAAAFGFCLCNGKDAPNRTQTSAKRTIYCAHYCSAISIVESRCILLFIDGLCFVYAAYFFSFAFPLCAVAAHCVCIKAACARDRETSLYWMQRTMPITKSTAEVCKWIMFNTHWWQNMQCFEIWVHWEIGSLWSSRHRIRARTNLSTDKVLSQLDLRHLRSSAMIDNSFEQCALHGDIQSIQQYAQFHSKHSHSTNYEVSKEE